MRVVIRTREMPPLSGGLLPSLVLVAFLFASPGTAWSPGIFDRVHPVGILMALRLPATNIPPLGQKISVPVRVDGCTVTSAQVGQWVERSSARHGVPAWLMLAIMYEESRLQPCLTSTRAAVGLMQISPVLARGLGVANAHDPEQNIDAAAQFLALLLKRHHGDFEAVRRAYKGLPPEGAKLAEVLAGDR